MLNEIGEILIHEEQLFEIDVKLGNSKYYSALINISPDNATLEVFGEVLDNEKLISYEHFIGENIDYLEGINSRYKFHFYDLSVFHFTQRSIYGAANRSAFHIKLFIKYFHLSIAHPSSHYKTNVYSSLKIYSPTITKWLGVTKKQLEIYRNSSKSKLPSKEYDLLYEFGVEIENKFNINILYNAKWRRDYNSHNTISEFPPCLNVNFRGQYPDFNQVKIIISEIISFFYALTGHPVMIEKAYLSFPSFTGQEPLYLSGSNFIGKGVENKDMLICYNSDHLFDKDQEPIFPIDSIHTYFCMEDEKKDVFKKFNFYDIIANKEDKFLGLFRVVEKLAYTESLYVEEELLNTPLENLKRDLITKGVKASIAKKLIGRFSKVNTQKINAESAILKFLKSLGEETYKEIKHLEVEIPKLVKLRNDMTHCKSYSLKENEIERFSLILNYICTLLLWREIGLSEHQSFRKFHKYMRFRDIRNREK